MKQACPSNHILPVSCGKEVLFVLSSEHMQNSSMWISINKRTLCVCAWHLGCQEKLIPSESFVLSCGSAGCKQWTGNTDPKISIWESNNSIKFEEQSWDLWTVSVRLLWMVQGKGLGMLGATWRLISHVHYYFEVLYVVSRRINSEKKKQNMSMWYAKANSFVLFPLPMFFDITFIFFLFSHGH